MLCPLHLFQLTTNRFDSFSAVFIVKSLITEVYYTHVKKAGHKIVSSNILNYSKNIYVGEKTYM